MDWRDDRIGSAARGENPTVLAELASGYAVIGDVQFLPGYCVLLSKNPHAKALAELPRGERVQFLADVDLLSTAVELACRESDPRFRRTNIDILGNADAFVHAHVWPRYEWERPELVWRPVWLYDLDSWKDPAIALGQQHAPLRTGIAAHLRRLADQDTVHIRGDDVPDGSVPDRAEIVCICGSMRFATEMRAVHRALTSAGVIVLAPGELGGVPTDDQKAALDALHLRKIDLADRVLVVNPGGYVGESTRREIAYAQAVGKPVAFTAHG